MGKKILRVLALLLVPGLVNAGSFTPLGFLSGDTYSISNGVSADGAVVAGTSGWNSGFQAFRWNDGAMTGLGFLPGDGASHAYGVSGDGAVVVGDSLGNNDLGLPIWEAARWTDGVVTGLGVLPGTDQGSYSYAYGASADGAVVVGQSGIEAFRWTGGVMSGLGFLPGVQLPDDIQIGMVYAVFDT